jgi:hypothetical protein
MRRELRSIAVGALASPRHVLATGLPVVPDETGIRLAMPEIVLVIGSPQPNRFRIVMIGAMPPVVAKIHHLLQTMQRHAPILHGHEDTLQCPPA